MNSWEIQSSVLFRQRSYIHSPETGVRLYNPLQVWLCIQSTTSILLCSTKQHHHLQRWLGLAQYVVKIINIEMGFDSASLRISYHLPFPSFLSCTECIALSVAAAVLRLYVFGTWCSGKSKSVSCTFLIWPCFCEKMYAKLALMSHTRNYNIGSIFLPSDLKTRFFLYWHSRKKPVFQLLFPLEVMIWTLLLWISQTFCPFSVSVLYFGVGY